MIFLITSANTDMIEVQIKSFKGVKIVIKKVLFHPFLH